MKSIILISSIVAVFCQAPKKVYVEKERGHTFIEYNSKDKDVNLFIDRSVISDKALQRGIKMYIASFFVKDNEVLKRDFVALYKKSLSLFAKQYKAEISNVIYYLEHADHGNLPLIYGRDAYELLEIKDLQPVISVFKEKLYKQDMYLIDIDTNEKPTPIVINSP